jgi:hypothetical protein
MKELTTFRKYLAEGKLREGIFDRFKNTSQPQNPKSDSPFFPNREISDNRLKIEKFIDKEWSHYTGAIDYNEIDDIVNGIEKEWVDNISKYSNIDAFLKDFKEDKRLKKYLAEGKLLKEDEVENKRDKASSKRRDVINKARQALSKSKSLKSTEFSFLDDDKAKKLLQNLIDHLENQVKVLSK